jgi:hypothetical protein
MTPPVEFRDTDGVWKRIDGNGVTLHSRDLPETEVRPQRRTMTLNQRTTLRTILCLMAVVLFCLAWYIVLGNDIFDSTNAAAFGYCGLAFFAASFLP